MQFLASVFLVVAVGTDTYVNDKYSYQIEYSPAIVSAKGEADAGDGQRLVSKDGRLQIAVWGQFDVLNETLATKMLAAIQADKLQVTYKVVKPEWFVLSGSKDGGKAIVYQKTIFEKGVFKTIRFEYPTADKDRFNRVVSAMVATFKSL